MAQPVYGSGGEPIEVMPVVVLFQVFPARPSSIPDIRDFVRRCLAESPLTEEGNRQVGETVFRALLDAAGPSGSIQVAFRIFPEHVEVDVLHSELQPRSELQPPAGSAAPAPAPGTAEHAAPAAGAPGGGPGDRYPRLAHRSCGSVRTGSPRTSPTGCRSRCAVRG